MAPTNVTRLGIAGRTRFFDDQVLAALDGGIRQVVICGAGYDDRALRFRSPGVRFFELDHPLTQADKRHRLDAIGADPADVTLIGADFRDADVATLLDQYGHDAGQPSVLLTEGLLIYLDHATGDRLLTGLRSRAAAGSILVASLAVHRAGLDSDHVAAIANSRRPNADREPWRTIMPVDDYVAALRQCGWRVGTAIDPAELEPGAPSGKTLLISAR
jgi:methyltransferase (TIGR00027 family)